MKYFICPIDRISLGIPADSTLRIIAVNRSQKAVYETEGEDIYISLPVLFRQNNTSAPHGIVLKSEKTGNTVLLTPRVEIDLEIPKESIQVLPEVFSPLFRYFKGVHFNEGNGILILNPESLMDVNI